MSTVSETLQRARLEQGIELATIAARTRIKTQYLQAIEGGDRKSLPGEFFYKSFVHQYATFLGVDTRAIDAEVDRESGAQVPASAPPAATHREGKPSSGIASKYLSYGALIVLLVACWGVDNWWHKSGAPLEQSTVHQATSSPLTPRVTPTSASHVVARSPDSATVLNPRVELALTATEETWLSISSDGAPVFSGLLEANQTKTIEGNDAKLRVGNAAGLEVRLNGKPLGPLGAHGQVRELDFPSDRFQSASQTSVSE
jgi:cytoskeletal protein RodZ